ncbi:hypothetical protein J5N97_008139 [Dioscorea zingiberensis]|uniref:Disease resistance R13L4/SHOC-2-like LRR domain-containing protein n=1 Tax=Dioscorea zingiberensis TaxID=325984 RepID=A0A9D5DFC1_9LILI|nr:hypothetical protein J5N97_008139 [Dioscorea zingiberensis]
MGQLSQSVDEIVQEIMRTHRSLPPRPCIEEVEAALVLVRNVEQEEQSRIDAIARQKKGFEIPDELFFVLQEMQRSLVFFQCKEQKREAIKLLDLENIHQLFDELIQRASRCIPSGVNGSSGSISASSTSTATASGSQTGFNSSSSSVSSTFYQEKTVTLPKSSEQITRDDSYLLKAKSTMHTDGISLELNNKPRGLLVNPTRNPSPAPLPVATSGGVGSEKLSLIKLASVIEVSSKKGTKDLNLQNKLMDQIDWLPDSIGKLSGLVTLDLSENHLLALPPTIGALSSLTRLDLHSNRIAELPDSIGELFSLQYLDVKGNQLTTLPSTLGKLVNLVELDLSSNRLSVLAEAIGKLISLKKLSVETNNLEELPHTIGNCASLVELRADYNCLKGLPEAVGRLASLEVLSVRYNNIKSLPTSMASLSKLKEIDASFNELESIPESLCLATNLVKLNIGNNFADLRSLPRSIGNLEMLEELDISNNQIRFLPDSFGMLSHLRVLRVEENPLEVPPRHIAEMGAQAVVQFMAEFVAKREANKTQSVKTKKSWAQCCFLSRPNKRKHDIIDYVKP